MCEHVDACIRRRGNRKYCAKYYVWIYIPL